MTIYAEFTHRSAKAWGRARCPTYGGRKLRHTEYAYYQLRLYFTIDDFVDDN